jgi:hypothetical protein
VARSPIFSKNFPEFTLDPEYEQVRNMLKLSLFGTVLVIVTVAIHAAGTTWWVRVLGRRYHDHGEHWPTRESLPLLASTAMVLVVLHAIEICIWALSYKVLVPVGELPSFEAAAYFSFVTFTTLGYGDITLSEGWRLLSGIQALNGILLVGWSTAVLFATVQRIWQGLLSTQAPD